MDAQAQLQEKDNNIIILLTVKPNQTKFRITRAKDKLMVCLKSKPEKNKANTELVNMLKKAFKKPVSIISGQKTKTKKIVVENTQLDEAIRILEKYTD